MKSERKPIQESNLLADQIEELAIQLKKAFPAIVAVTAVVVVALFGYGFYTTIKETESAKGWTALYFSDTDTAQLSAISSDFDGTTAGLWAKQTSADAKMAKALDNVYLDRDLAEKFYNDAKEDYKMVAEKSSDPFLVGRAHFGMAQACEGLGDVAQSLSFYRKVITNKAMGDELIADTTKRVAWLESKAGEEFYAWYKTSRASAPILNSNPATKPPLPDAPNFTLPNTNTLPNSNTPATDAGPATPATDAGPAIPTSNSETSVPPGTSPTPPNADLEKGNETPSAQAEKKP